MRKELKFHISPHQAFLLEKILSPFCDKDVHGYPYKVTSVYFDTIDNKLLYEKTDGVSRLGKVRLRYYNDNMASIKLEYKEKKGDWVEKTVKVLDEEGYRSLLADPNGIQGYFPRADRHLKPKIRMTYERYALQYRGMDVRFTIDRQMKVQVGHGYARVSEVYDIFEIKYTDGLPVHLSHLLSDLGIRESISKYAVGRHEI